MKAQIKKYPTGRSYINLPTLQFCSWHEFPGIAEVFLKSLGSMNIKKASPESSMDSHWYQFDWMGGSYLLIYDEWPRQVVIESETQKFKDLLVAIDSQPNNWR